MLLAAALAAAAGAMTTGQPQIQLQQVQKNTLISGDRLAPTNISGATALQTSPWPGSPVLRALAKRRFRRKCCHGGQLRAWGTGI